MPTGGSIQRVSIDGSAWSATADNESNIDPGGGSNENQPNGDQVTSRIIKTAGMWKIPGLVLSIDWANGDMQLLRSIKKKKDNVAIEITLADDTVLRGVGQIVGDMTGNTQTSTMSLDLSGPGDLT